MKYAANVMDMLVDEALSQLLIAPLITDRMFFSVERDRIDGMAVPLNCDDEQFENVLWTIRRRYEKNKFRLYKKVGNEWVRV